MEYWKQHERGMLKLTEAYPFHTYLHVFPRIHRLFTEGREIEFVRSHPNPKKLCFYALMHNSARECRKERMRRCGLPPYDEGEASQFYADVALSDGCTRWMCRHESRILKFPEEDNLLGMFPDICHAFTSDTSMDYMENVIHQLKGIRASFTILLQVVRKNRIPQMIDRCIDIKEHELWMQHAINYLQLIARENEVVPPGTSGIGAMAPRRDDIENTYEGTPSYAPEHPTDDPIDDTPARNIENSNREESNRDALQTVATERENMQATENDDDTENTYEGTASYALEHPTDDAIDDTPARNIGNSNHEESNRDALQTVATERENMQATENDDDNEVTYPEAEMMPLKTESEIIQGMVDNFIQDGIQDETQRTAMETPIKEEVMQVEKNDSEYPEEEIIEVNMVIDNEIKIESVGNTTEILIEPGISLDDENELKYPKQEVIQVKMEREDEKSMNEVSCSTSRGQKTTTEISSKENEPPAFHKNNHICKVHRLKPLSIVLKQLTASDLNKAKCGGSKRQVKPKYCTIPCCRALSPQN